MAFSNFKVLVTFVWNFVLYTWRYFWSLKKKLLTVNWILMYSSCYKISLFQIGTSVYLLDKCLLDKCYFWDRPLLVLPPTPCKSYSKGKALVLVSHCSVLIWFLCKSIVPTFMTKIYQNLNSFLRCWKLFFPFEILRYDIGSIFLFFLYTCLPFLP